MLLWMANFVFFGDGKFVFMILMHLALDVLWLSIIYINIYINILFYFSVRKKFKRDKKIELLTAIFVIYPIWSFGYIEVCSLVGTMQKRNAYGAA